MDKSKKAKFKKNKEEGRLRKALIQKTGDKEYSRQKKAFGKVFTPHELDEFEEFWED